MSGTQALYLTDSYLRTCDARVVGRDEHSVVLDRTVFFPRGGGQMADRGCLLWEKQRIPVIAVEKRGDDIVHTLDGPVPPAGSEVILVPAHIDPIRTVDIVGLDVQADGGTHVANTLEIGGIRITKTENKGRENRRLEIKLLPTLE